MKIFQFTVPVYPRLPPPTGSLLQAWTEDGTAMHWGSGCVRVALGLPSERLPRGTFRPLGRYISHGGAEGFNTTGRGRGASSRNNN